jgi:uncharacterized protein (DUF4415 family)
MSKKGASDWARVKAMSDQQTIQNAHEDLDALPADEAFWADAVWRGPTEKKIPIHIRLRPEVLEFFKRSGPGYQQRINRVLEAYVEHQSKSAG